MRCRSNVAEVAARPKHLVEDEIAHLRGLDLGGLRARWQGVFQRSAPAHLTRHLLFAVISAGLIGKASRNIIRSRSAGTPIEFERE